ncbi:MAG: hypothetical protein NVSMB25_05290 [Thermoleophilaceae bacterium]
MWLLLAKPAAGLAGLLLVCLFTLAVLTGAGVLVPPGGCEATVTRGGSVPAFLTEIYSRAAHRYGLGPRGPAVLASINRIESNFGRDLSTSRAGAVGWMQFEPGTWAIFGVDANGDGSRDPSDPWDAIFAAAAYLRASGAPRDWSGAIFAYNHAQWYVQSILADADRSLLAAQDTEVATGACATSESPGGHLGRLLAEANRLDALHSQYVYGGGHTTPAPASPPWDCSAAWSRVLQVAGIAVSTLDSTGFMTWGSAGPGRHVTIYATAAHVYGTIDGRPWGTSGPGSNPRNPGGGPAWLPYRENPTPGFPGGRPAVRHPPGL